MRRAIERPRLFDALDDARCCPCMWLCAPPGAGKTTLVAGYVRARGLRSVWLQLDAADADPATFFYFLRSALQLAATRRAHLPPLFTPEYRQDLTAFSRRFMRTAVAALGGDAVVVLDNFQELGDPPALSTAIAACLEELPERLNVIVISRTEPPAAFARAQVNSLVARVGWESMRLTPAETAALARERGIRAPHIVRALHDRTSGWVAGLVLLTDRTVQAVDAPILDGPASMEFLFDYFAAQVFDALPATTREVAVAVSLLPHISAKGARAVSGCEDAIVHIDALHRRSLFTDRVDGEIPVYRYHALFRAFLRSRALRLYTAADMHERLQHAAASFEADGDLEHAFHLHLEARALDRAGAAFIAHAPSLIAQGRWQTLLEWHTLLAAADAPRNPWIGLWMGRGLSPVDPVAARGYLEGAFEAFRAVSDDLGRLLCAVGVLETLYFEYDAFRPMDRWIDEVAAHLVAQAPALGPGDALWAHAVFMVACCYRSPGHALLPRAVARVEALLPGETDVNLSVTAASMLHFYAYAAADANAAAVATHAARPLLGSDQLTAQRAALYLGEEGYGHYAFVRYPEALACFDEAEVIVNEHALRHLESRCKQWRGFCERRAGMLHEAKLTLERLTHLPHPRQGIRACLTQILAAYIAFDEGDVQGALDTALAAQQMGVEAGKTTIVLMHVIHAGMLIEAAQFARATELLDTASALANGTILAYQLGPIALMRALLAIRAESAGVAIRATSSALSASRKPRELQAMRWYPRALSEAVGFALEHGIEVEHARRLIAQCRLPAHDNLSAAWPRKVKIRTLGGFELLVDDAPPSYSRKLPYRVLLLLKLMIAFGGTDVPEQRLADTLWPDLDGDAASRALAALVHRLRALLRDADALHHRGGTLSLDSQRCWVDVFALRHRARSPLPQPFPAVLDLYRGAFLPGEDEPWAQLLRERARDWVIALMRRHAEALERAGALHEAAACHAAVQERDDGLEPRHSASSDQAVSPGIRHFREAWPGRL
ncbi:MAG: AAA family ATPase [Burkholderiales bacterium]|nr:AAA family ATPase [Burkholderiales bacterium]